MGSTIIYITSTDPRVFFITFLVCCCLLFLLIVVLICKWLISNSHKGYKRIGDAVIHSSNIPTEFLNDEEELIGLANEYDFNSLSPEEQASYYKGEEFCRANPPELANTRGRSIKYEDELIIKERGILAFEFEQDVNLLLPRYIVQDRTEINFLDTETPYATATSVLNYCLPVRNRTFSDCIYFETKVFEFNNSMNPNAHFAIGLVTKPYPSSFRLPGYNNFSIAYESTGNLKINKPFPTPLQQHWGANSQYNALVLPPLSQSDVVGFGYHVLSGTVFITRNGKKVMDVMKGVFVDMYPAVGCFLTNAKFQVNLGQMGFVWIEANVKKYGFISTNDFRKIKGERGLAALPQYGTSSSLQGDQLLDKGEELPPDYPEEELDFFGRSRHLLESSSRQASQFDEKGRVGNSMITHEPEEIMDLRERIYEQNTTTLLDSVTSEAENLPLLGNHANYGSNKEEVRSAESHSAIEAWRNSYREDEDYDDEIASAPEVEQNSESREVVQASEQESELESEQSYKSGQLQETGHETDQASPETEQASQVSKSVSGSYSEQAQEQASHPSQLPHRSQVPSSPEQSFTEQVSEHSSVNQEPEQSSGKQVPEQTASEQASTEQAYEQASHSPRISPDTVEDATNVTNTETNSRTFQEPQSDTNSSLELDTRSSTQAF